jgi:hypothetical protein
MTVGHFPPIFENLPGWHSDIFLPFLKICQNDYGTISSHFMKICQDDSWTFFSHFWKFARMTVGHFPPVFENLTGWRWDILLPFLKVCQNDSQTFSSHFWKFDRTQTFSSHFWKFTRMTMGHFPPVLKNLPEWRSDIFLLFLKIHNNDNWTFSSFFWKFARMMVGHFPPVFENLSE